MKHTSTYTVMSWSLALIFAAAVFVATPVKAHAFDFGRLIDPACFFACDNKPSKTIKNYTYTNSNNVNSNVNSPGGVVVGNSYAQESGSGSLVTPAYSYNDGGSYNPPSYDAPLQVNCYALDTYVRRGDSARWRASAWGGNGSYNYSWSGTNGLSGNGSSVNKSYSSTGYKNATVTVRSGGQTASYNCEPGVNVYDDGYYNGGNDYDYNDYYYPISVSCSADTNYAQVGNTVTWRAYVSGGNGDYDYRWSGTDGLSGSGRSASLSYRNPGQKYGSVTVYAQGRTVTQNCSNAVSVTGYQYAQPVPQYPYPPQGGYGQGLDVACFADETSVRVNQPVIWKAEVTGGFAPYTYVWSGGGVNGTQAAAVAYYGSAGTKTASVTVTSADGRSGTALCSNSVTVRAAVTSNPAPQQPSAPQNTTNDGLTAASLFSLQNVPWGWVAMLVILVLFATVLYLLFNRQKI